MGTPFSLEKLESTDISAANQLQRQAQQWIYAAQSWLAGSIEESIRNLQGLQIFCLLILARQATGLGSSPTFSPGSLLSMAMQMGLHRDIWTFTTLSRVQIEPMARLWMTIVELSLASCLESGIPFSAVLGDFHAQEPPDINNNSGLSDGNVIDEIPALGDLETDSSIQQLLSKSQKLRIQALQIVSGIGPPTSYETVVSLSTQIRSACTELSLFFSARSSEWKFAHAFHSKYIDTYLRKHILLLHRPFMLAAQQDPRFYLSRKICLESCMIMASYNDAMDSPSKKLDDFSNLMIRGSGYLRGGLSPDVIVTLAYELNAQLQEGGGAQGPHSYDPAHELARAAWQPIKHRLAHIQKQVSQIIALGKSSLKTFIMVSAVLAQLETVEGGGGNAKTAFYGAIMEAIRGCTESLKTYLASQPAQATHLNAEAQSWPKDHDSSLSGLLVSYTIVLIWIAVACNIRCTLH